MSRFEYIDDYDGEGMPAALWERAVSTALGGKQGQQVLADMEAALEAMPSKRLIEGHLAKEGDACAVGAYIAHMRAKAYGVEMHEAIARLAATQDPDEEFPDPMETADAGHRAGMQYTVAWHFEYLNDETFRAATPEERYEKMLAWVRRAQGKPETQAA